MQYKNQQVLNRDIMFPILRRTAPEITEDESMAVR